MRGRKEGGKEERAGERKKKIEETSRGKRQTEGEAKKIHEHYKLRRREGRKEKRHRKQGAKVISMLHARHSQRFTRIANLKVGL